MGYSCICNYVTRSCLEYTVDALVYKYCNNIVMLTQQTKVYQHSCHNTNEAYSKLTKSKEKVDTSKGARKKKAVDKDMEVSIA